MLSRIFLIIIFIFIHNNPGEAKAEVENNKTRLAKIINNYTPTIVPVISFDGKYLFFDRKEHPENTGGYNDNDEIWYSELKQGKFWSVPKRLSFPINTTCSDVLFSLSPDGSKALIYGKTPVNNTSKCRTDGYSILSRQNNEFDDFQAVNIENYHNNSKNYYACLSADLKVIILSLKNDKSLGREDLFVSFHNDSNDTWTEPANMGSIINTNLDEISPYLAYDCRTLYFASDGRKNYGDFDLFMTRRLDSSWLNWSEPVNLGKSINSRFMESGFSLTSMSDTAYFISSEYEILQSSNPYKLYDTIDFRHGIYSAKLPKEFQPLPYKIIRGKIYKYLADEKTLYKNKVIFHTTFDSGFNRHFDYHADLGSGEYLFIIPPNVNAKVKINEPMFKDIEFYVNTDSLKSPEFYNKDIILEEKAGIIKSELTIYFAVNDSMLTQENEKGIYKLLAGYNDIKHKKIKITGHADETGTEEYNTELSTRRAKSVMAYLRMLGITEKNILIEGKGEQYPISSDPCLNRRVEIDILDK